MDIIVKNTMIDSPNCVHRIGDIRIKQRLNFNHLHRVATDNGKYGTEI